jgi:NAD-dependent SIR2 family protein deacetylase
MTLTSSTVAAPDISEAGATDIVRLAEFVAASRRLFVLTGAGCSTESGIPDYRDSKGGWKRRPPVMLQDFLGSETARARYWARSLIGWPQLQCARPNGAHRALAQLQARGDGLALVTQNVDGLHQAAGSENVIDLHGRIDTVRCLGCERRMPRTELQQVLLALNPHWSAFAAAAAPDGDADLDGMDFSAFRIPACAHCAGLLKPDVVFFGENVPPERVEQTFAQLQRSDAVLVVGSSLMVFSGLRFIQRAADLGLPIAAVNLGQTRAERLLQLKVEQPCAHALQRLLSLLP